LGVGVWGLGPGVWAPPPNPQSPIPNPQSPFKKTNNIHSNKIYIIKLNINIYIKKDIYNFKFHLYIPEFMEKNFSYHIINLFYDELILLSFGIKVFLVSVVL